MRRCLSRQRLRLRLRAVGADRITLGGSGGRAFLPEGKDLVAGPERRRPRDVNGVLHALMRRTSLGMSGQRALGRLAGLRGHAELVVHMNRFDMDGLADAGDAAFDGGTIRLAVELDLAPCQGAA